MESRRIEVLVDGVFAVAMTLLVLGIRVPDVADPITSAAMTSALGAIVPHLAGYLVSFVILGTLWIGHREQSHLLRRADRTLLWINVLFLLFVALVPFTTAFLARYPLQPVALAVYGFTLLLAGVLLLIRWNHAVGAGLVAEEVTPEVAEVLRERISMGLVVYLIATIAGAFLPKVGLVLFACTPVLYLLPSRVDPRLAEEADEA